MILNILDIDIDVFVTPIFYGMSETELRLSDSEYNIWEISELKLFLEQNCKLSTKNKTKGAIFKHHVELFNFLRDKVITSNEEISFNIDHLDAHADMGAGDDSILFVCDELLKLPVKERYFATPNDYYQQIGSGNVLLYILACRFTNQINFVKQEKTVFIHPFLFYNNDSESNFLQLKRMNPDELFKIFINNDLYKNYEPIGYEPKVKCNKTTLALFKTEINYDYVCVTLSKGFTPSKIDCYIPLFKEYIILEN